jgi:hypothetical protein
MKRYAPSVLIPLTLMPAAKMFGQDEKPHLEQYLHNQKHESAHRPEGCAAMLDRAFYVMYDLEFREPT